MASEKEVNEPAEVNVMELAAEASKLKGQMVKITQFTLASKLLAFEQLIDRACDNQRPNLQWRAALATEWGEVKTEAKADVMLHIEKLSWSKLRNSPPTNKFQFQLHKMGRSNLLNKDHPEDLLLKHAQFIIENIEGIQSDSVWMELYGFDADSAIYTTAKPARPKSRGENSVDAKASDRSKTQSSQNTMLAKKNRRQSSVAINDDL